MVQRCLYSLVGFLQSRRLWIMRHGKSLVGAFAAAASVAGEPNARVAVSATLAAGVSGCGDSRGAHLSSACLLFSCGQGFLLSEFQLLAENTGPTAAVSCCVFPALYIDFESFHVALTYVFVAELGAANRSLSRGKFAVQNVFGNTAHVAKPAQPTLSEQREHSGQTSACKDLGVGHFAAPLYAEDATELAHVGTVQLALLLGIRCPCFTAIEESADDAGVVHCHFRWI